MTTEFKEGQRVHVAGKRGVFVVHRAEPQKDGSILVYGGSTNPNAIRMFRNVMPDKLKPVVKKGR